MVKVETKYKNQNKRIKKTENHSNDSLQVPSVLADTILLGSLFPTELKAVK